MTKKKPETNELQLSKAEETQLSKIDDALQRYSLSALHEQTRGAVEMTVMTARAQAGLTNLIKDFLPDMINLAGTQAGFGTDRKYPPEVILDSVVTALMHGVSPVGQEMFILGGKFYCTKVGMLAKIQRHPRIGRYECLVGEPESIRKVGEKEVSAYMPVHCEYTVDGQEQVLDAKFYCRAHTGGPAVIEALQGKAQRKAAQQVLQNVDLFATPVADPDPEIVEVEASVLHADLVEEEETEEQRQVSKSSELWNSKQQEVVKNIRNTALSFDLED